MSDPVLEKVVTRNEVAEAGGGLLNADQANRFIDYMWDATVLGKECRRIRMVSDVQEIDKIGVGRRIARLATEAVDTGVNAPVQFTKISITTRKIRLDWEISTESLEDNIEGADLEDHIARMMATQFGNDLEDLAINGDTDSSDPLLKSFDGWDKLMREGAHVVDAGGDGLDRGVFNAALKAVPRHFMQRRGQLKWYTGSNAIQDYLYTLSDPARGSGLLADSQLINGPTRTEGAAGFTTGFAFGIPVLEVPLFDEQVSSSASGGGVGDNGHLELTFPQNRLWGVKRDVVVYREFAPKKDTVEYTLYVRTGVQIEELDAAVYVQNVGISE